MPTYIPSRPGQLTQPGFSRKPRLCLGKCNPSQWRPSCFHGDKVAYIFAVVFCISFMVINKEFKSC